MYTLTNLTTLKDNQTKQINILNGTDVPYKRYYYLDTYEDKANIVIEFANKGECGLGIPMPKGKVKLYKEDQADNSLEFIGEDEIDHTPKDEDIKLTIGNAFDITFDFKQVDRRKLGGFEYHAYECTTENHKEEAAEIHFDHGIWGVWEMVSSTHEYEKKTSNLIAFTVNVPADSKLQVCFEYRVDRRLQVTIDQ